MGERTVKVTASVTIAGQTINSSEQSVTFGAGPLSVFKAPLSGNYRWADNQPISDGGNTAVGNFPAAYACGTALTATELRGLADGYHATTKLPSVAQLQEVSESGNRAWFAAGWSDYNYWTGQVSSGGDNADLVVRNGGGIDNVVINSFPVVCLR